MEIELYINNEWQRMESDRSTNTLTLSFTAESLENPSDYYSEFSYPFKLPKTSRNNTLLNHVGELDSRNNNIVFKYRLYGENNEVISEGNAVVQSVTLKDYTLQLNGSMGICFKSLINSGFSESDDPNYYKLPDIISYDGSDYTAKVELNNKLVYTSFNVNSQFIPFELGDLYDAYGDLFFSYYFNVERYNELDEQMAWLSSFVGFLPQMQGRYKNFDSTKWANGNTIRPLFGNEGDENTIDVGSGATEWQMQQYRSYYQTPFVYVQKMWELYKQYCPNITDYTLNLDSRWYNENNTVLRDIVYTLPNIGNSEKVTPNVKESDTAIGTNYIMFPSNNQYNSNTHRIAGLNDSNHIMSLYSELKEVGKNELLNFTAEIPIEFQNNFSNQFALFSPYQWTEGSVTHIATDTAIAFNQNSPLYVEWSVVDSSYNTVYESHRPFVLIPLVKTADYTEEWTADYRQTWEERADIIMWYYTPESFYIDPADIHAGTRNVAHFGTCQLQSTWQNNVATGQYRLKFTMHFLFNLVPFLQFRPQMPDNQGDGKFLYCPHGNNNVYCTPENNPNAYIKFITDYTAKTQVFEPSRSYRHITTGDLFGDEKPFNVLLKFSKMCNLVWNIDEKTKTINVLRKYDYLSDCTADGFYNLTDKINTDKGLTIETQTFNADKVLFQFADSQDKYSKEYNKKFGNNYGSLTVYTGQNAGGEPVKVFEKDTAKFLPTIVATDILTTRKNMELQNVTRDETPVALPSNQSDSGEFAGDSGVFYLRGYQWQIETTPFAYYTDGEPFIYITDDSPAEVQANTYCHQDDTTAAIQGFKTHYLPQFFEHTRNENVTIWFGEPREVYYDIPQAVLTNSVSVYDSEWKDYITELYSLNNKRVTCYAILTAKEFDRLKANPLCQIQNVIYTLEKMEYSPNERLSKLTLRTLSKLPNFN